MTYSATLAATTVSLCIARAAGHPEFVALLPNGDNVPGVEAVGHVNPEGDGALNAFGDDFHDMGKAWTLELCEADSDGDGQTNGQELGDPCCEWVADADATPRWTEGVSNPGDATEMADESLWASVDCSNVTSSIANSTDTAVGDSDDDVSSEEESSHDHSGSVEGAIETPTSGATVTAAYTMAGTALSLALALMLAA